MNRFDSGRRPVRVASRLVLAAVVAVASTAALAGDAERDAKGDKGGKNGKVAEPDHVVVQHVLIGFKKSIPGSEITRTRKEAEALANEILERARAGEPFEDLMREYSDDSGAGVYALANRGVPRKSRGEYARDGMVPAFGDVAFKLEVGAIDIAHHGYQASPYGWHIIKRIE